MRVRLNGMLRLFKVSCLFAAVFAVVQSAAALQDNKGTEFVLSFTPNYNTSSLNIEVHLTADVATDVTIEYPVNSPTFTTTVPVTPGNIVTVALPSEAAQGWLTDSVVNNAVHMSSDKEFVAYLINRYPYTSDAALGLPIDVLNTEYIVATFDEPGGWSYPAHFTVTGVYDNTAVTVTPSNDLIGGHAAGVPYVFTLNRGEGILLEQLTSGINGGLAGTTVSADKPVSVTNGNRCTQVPIGTTACDTLMEVAQPVQSWGQEVLVLNTPDRPSGVVYRILASQDATEVLQDGASIGTVNRGQFLQVGPLAGSHVFSSSNPIFVVQFLTGLDSPGATSGDPAMANFGPKEQYLNAYTFATVGGGQFANHFLMVIAANTDVGSITLDGVAMNAAEFSPISGSDYSSAVFSLPEGTHQTASSSGHGIWVLGYNNYDSYSFPGGAKFQSINNLGDPWAPICASSLVLGESTYFDLQATEHHPEEVGEGITNRETGIFLVELLDGATNLALAVPVFVPGVPELSFTATVVDPELPGTGTVRVTDGAGNYCEAILDSGVAVDCEGVPGGGKVPDRCGVCGGDGMSCCQCTESDITSMLNGLSGDALKAHKHNLKLFRGLKRQWTLQKNLTKQSIKLFRKIQALLLTFPSLARECLNSEFCVTVSDNQNKLDQYRKLMRRLVSLAKKLGSGVCNGTAAECRSRRNLLGADNFTRALFEKSQNKAANVPGLTSVCD